MKNLSRGLLAAVCASVVLTSVAEAATVTIRVEGTSSTLIPETTVTTVPGTVTKDGDPSHTCRTENAIGALEQASGGQWSGTWYGGTLGYGVETIKGETHNDASGGEYYGFFYNKAFNMNNGLCSQAVQDGDEILLYPTCYDADCTYPAPLDVTFPRVVQAREGFSVKVDRLADDGKRTPEAGATVTVAGRSATTGPDGTATLAVDQAGDAEIVATSPNSIRDTGNRVCVHDGNDGRCGFPGPAGASSSTAPAAQSSAVFVADRTAPRVAIRGIREGQVFQRRRAPKLLRGVAQDSSGLLMVKVRLTRNDRGRCSAYSVKRERFVRTRCGVRHGWYSKIGDRAEFEYQLAKRLPRGRYVIDVNAVDKAFNRDDERRRGQNRLVFRVR